jgi:hypothetical protein
MKKPYIVAISSLIGFLFGAGSLIAFIYFGPFLSANDVMRANAEESIMHANLLRDGKGDKVLKILDQYLPSAIYMYENIGFRNDGDLSTAWMIRDYVEQHRIPLAASQSEFLAKLPARPTCSSPVVNK